MAGSVILALDTSTAIASVALYDGSVTAETTWHAGRNHSVELMPQVLRLLELQRLTSTDLSAVAIACGPGSYTGLRVGLSAAKGLCLALGIPLVGIPTLDILAWPHQTSCIPVRPVLDAGRKRYATALYRSTDGNLSRVGPVEGKRMPEILASLNEETLLCGDLAEYRSIDLPGLAKLASPASSLRRAGFLAEIGWKRYEDGKAVDASQVEAFYLGREGS